MIDIETFGTGEKPPIVSIGACRFTYEDGVGMDNLFYLGCSLGDNKLRGRLPEADTTDWWMRQSVEAKDALFSVPQADSFADMIKKFRDWAEAEEATRIWAKPPSFDLRIMKGAFESCGIRWPWHWGCERDARVIQDMARKFRITAALEAKPEIPHRADHDAIAQAQMVVEVDRWIIEKAGN